MAHYKVDRNIYLSPLQLKDINLLVKYLNDKEIINNTLNIPFPYTQKDGEDFINLCKNNKQKFNTDVNWAIRDRHKKLIGGCGFQKKYKQSLKKDEIGYWLARPFWNKGIMTKVVLKLCKIGFEKFKLNRIEASVFFHNDASCRVLEKAGFIFGGILRGALKKKNKAIDVKLYFIEKNDFFSPA